MPLGSAPDVLLILDKQLISRSFKRSGNISVTPPLCLSDVRPIGDVARKAAFQQVMNYFHQNQDEMRRIIQTEVDVSLEKDGYILTGKVDLLMGGDGKLEILDFKTSPRPTDSPDLLEAYERQLCTYAHILEQRHGRTVDRLLLYWTAEPEKDKARMALPYRPDRIEEAGVHFDETVKRIQAKEFQVTNPPEGGICKECDLRLLCHAEGIISREARG
jgi:DNA helicase-2/ATP-dependent DNA helicase PcrA